MFDVYLEAFMHELYCINLELAQEFEHTTPDPYDPPWDDAPGMYLDWDELPAEPDPAYRPKFWAPTPRGACATPLVPCDDIPF